MNTPENNIARAEWTKHKQEAARELHRLIEHEHNVIAKAQGEILALSKKLDAVYGRNSYDRTEIIIGYGTAFRDDMNEALERLESALSEMDSAHKERWIELHGDITGYLEEIETNAGLWKTAHDLGYPSVEQIKARHMKDEGAQGLIFALEQMRKVREAKEATVKP